MQLENGEVDFAPKLSVLAGSQVSPRTMGYRELTTAIMISERNTRREPQSDTLLFFPFD